MVFEGEADTFKQLRNVLDDPNHQKIYWVTNDDGRFPCHFCEKSYANIGSVRTHENVHHGKTLPAFKSVKKTIKNEDQLLTTFTHVV